MANISDHSEKLNLFEKTLEIEERQNQRAHEQNTLEETEKERERVQNLMSGNSTMASVLEQEDVTRNELVHEMNINANNDNLKPVVKVLTNISGGMGKNRRNHENTNEVVKVNHKELTCLREEMKEVKAMVASIAQHVERSTFKKVMSGPDMSEFFPVERGSQLVDFMDRQHPEWPARRDEFAFYLFNCITDYKKAFTKGLLKTLFTREYMSTVKWPRAG